MEGELGECELGTQEYWNKRYKEEIENYKHHGDVGDVWFGEDIVERILNWMNKNVVDKAAKIVDLGCGNGMLSIELYNANFTNIVGIDYSADAINLAKQVAEQQSCHINFQVANILEPNNRSLSEADIMLDKGTYDAISLSTDARINRKTYIENVCKLMKPDGQLVMTSCNWTKDELSEQFSSHFECAAVIPTPQFKFAGKVGNLVSSVIFKKK